MSAIGNSRRLIVSLFCLVCLVCIPCRALAVDVERREFSVLIDGKEAGISRMVITVQDDGVTVMQGNCTVKFTKVLLNFNFQIEATEWWKDGKLIGLKSKSTENGKSKELSVASDGARLMLKTGREDRLVRPEAWTTSYWKLAEAKFHNKPVPLFDPEDGKEYNGQLQYVGTEQILVGKAPQSCYRFKVTGGPQTIDVWFDRYHRLVRQEFTKQGHRVIVQLNSVQR